MNYLDKNQQNIQKEVETEFKTLDNKGGVFRDDGEILAAGVKVIDKYINEIKKSQENYGPWALEKFIQLQQEFIKAQNSLKGIRITSSNTNRKLINDVAHKIDNAEAEVIRRLNLNKETKRVDTAIKESQNTTKKNFFEKQSDGSLLLTKDTNKPKIQEVLGSLFKNESGRYEIDYSECTNSNIKNKINALIGTDTCWIQYNQTTGTYNLLNSEGRIISHRAYVWEGVKIKTEKQIAFQATSKKLDQINKSIDYTSMADKSGWEATPAWAEKIKLIPDILKTKLEKQSLLREFMIKSEERLDNIVREQKKLGWELDLKNPISKTWISGGLMEVHFVSKDALKKEPFFNKDMISKDLYSFLDGQESNLKTYLTSRLEQKREQFEHFTKREDAFEGTTGPEKQGQKELEKFTTELERKQYNVGLLNALINSIEKKYGVAKTALGIDFRAQSTLMDLKKKSRDLLYTLESKNPTTEEWGKIQEEITTLFINYLGKEHKGGWNFDAQIKEFMGNVFNGDKKKAIEGIRRLGNSLTMLDNSLSGFLKDEIMNDGIEEAKSGSPEAIAIENKEYDKIFKNIYTKLKLDVAGSLDDEGNLSETETKKLIDDLYAQPGARELFEYLKQQGLLPKNIEFSDKKVGELTNNLYETLKNKKNNSENFTITSEQFLKEYEEITLELEAKENKTDDEIAILQSQKVLLQNPDLVESLVSEKIKRTQAAIKYGGIDKDVISTFGPFLIEKGGGLSSGANKDIYNDMIGVGFWNLSDESIEVATEMAKILAEEVVFMVIVMVLLPTGAGAAGVISARVAKRGKRFASRGGKLKKGKTSLTMAKMTKNSKSMTNIANKMGKVGTKIGRGVERYGSTVALGVGRGTLHTALATTYRGEWDKSFKEHVVYALQNMSMYGILGIVGKSAESGRIANLFSKGNKVVNPKKINATRFFAEELLMNPADMMINFSFGNQPLTKEELATNIALGMVFEMIASIKLPGKIKPEPITDMVLYKENVSINGVEISHTQLPVLFEANKAQIDLKKAELQEGGAKRKIKQEANRKTKDFNENKIVELESQKKKLIDGEIKNNKLLEQQKNNLNDLKDLISRDKNTINDHIKEIDKLKDIEKGKRNGESIEAKANDISQYRESYYRDFAKESHPDLYNRFQKALLDNNQLELQKLDIELGERLILDNSKSGKILYDDKGSWKNIETRARESKKLLEKQGKYKGKIELVAESGGNRGIYILDDEAVKSINKINTAIKTIKKRIAANEKAVIDLEEQIIKNSSDGVYKQQLDKFNQEIDDLRNENAKLDEEHRALEDEENSQYAEPKAETTSDIKEPEAQISPDVKANPTSDIKVESIENESLENFEKRIFEEFSKYKNDPEALKKLYREYAKIYHPDRGGKEEMFKILDEINKSFTKGGEQYKFRESSASKNAPAEHVREQPESFTKNNSFDSGASNVQETMSRVESFGFWLGKNAVGPSMERYKNAFNWLRGISIPDKKIKETMSKLRSSFQEKTKLLLKKFDRLVTKDSPKQKIDNDISALSKLIKDRESEYQKANYIGTQEEMRLQIAAFKKYHQYLKKYGADREVYRKRDENIIRDDIFDKKAETKAKTESETKTNQPTSEAKAEKSRNSNPKDVFYRSKKDTNIEANRSLEEILHDDFDEKILSPAGITIDGKNYRLEFRQNMTQNAGRKGEVVWIEDGKVIRSVKSDTFSLPENNSGANAIRDRFNDLRDGYIKTNMNAPKVATVEIDRATDIVKKDLDNIKPVENKVEAAKVEVAQKKAVDEAQKKAVDEAQKKAVDADKNKVGEQVNNHTIQQAENLVKRYEDCDKDIKGLENEQKLINEQIKTIERREKLEKQLSDLDQIIGEYRDKLSEYHANGNPIVENYVAGGITQERYVPIDDFLKRLSDLEAQEYSKKNILNDLETITNSKQDLENSIKKIDEKIESSNRSKEEIKQNLNKIPGWNEISSTLNTPSSNGGALLTSMTPRQKLEIFKTNSETGNNQIVSKNDVQGPAKVEAPDVVKIDVKSEAKITNYDFDKLLKLDGREVELDFSKNQEYRLLIGKHEFSLTKNGGVYYLTSLEYLGNGTGPVGLFKIEEGQPFLIGKELKNGKGAEFKNSRFLDGEQLKIEIKDGKLVVTDLGKINTTVVEKVDLSERKARYQEIARRNADAAKYQSKKPQEVDGKKSKEDVDVAAKVEAEQKINIPEKPQQSQKLESLDNEIVLKRTLEQVTLEGNGAGIMGSAGAGMTDFSGKMRDGLFDTRFGYYNRIANETKYSDKSFDQVQSSLLRRKDYVEGSLQKINNVSGEVRGVTTTGFDLYYEVNGKNNKVISFISKARQLEIRGGSGVTYWMAFDVSTPKEVRLEFANKMISKLDAQEKIAPYFDPYGQSFAQKNALVKNWTDNFEATKKEVIAEMFPTKPTINTEVKV